LTALRVEGFPSLIDGRELDRAAYTHITGSDGLLAREHFYERGLARTVRAHYSHYRSARHFKAQIINEDAVADLLPQILRHNNFFPETRARRDPNSTGTHRRIICLPRGIHQRVV